MRQAVFSSDRRRQCFAWVKVCRWVVALVCALKTDLVDRQPNRGAIPESRLVAPASSAC